VTAEPGSDSGNGAQDGGSSKNGEGGHTDSGQSDSGKNGGGGTDSGKNGDGGSGKNGDGGGADSGKNGDGGGGGACPSTAGANGEAVTISAGAACTLAQELTADRTLSVSECAVYDAPNGLSVGGNGGISQGQDTSPVLTIGPGVTVAFGTGTGLQVGASESVTNNGGLIVQGTECAPVVFTTNVATAPKPGDWGTAQLDYQTLGTSSISHLILQYAGGADNARANNVPAASLLLDGSGGDFTVPISDVTASHNYSGGIVFFGVQTGLSATSSGTLTVTDWKATADPFAMDVNMAGALSAVNLSTGSTTGGFVHLFQSDGNSGLSSPRPGRPLHLSRTCWARTRIIVH
jgi:hypothetical protein